MTEDDYQFPTARTHLMDRLDAGVLDLLVVGGGIVGAGVARDAAMRGLSIAVVDRYDFAFGSSSRSSRLLHGGIRYLAQGRIGLVREASNEKVILSRIAPHLARPLPFVFPTFKESPWSRWKLRIGVKLYDMLCRGRNLGRSRGLTPAQAIELVPGLRTEGLTGGVRYFDGFTNDARLVLDTLRSAARHGALPINYLALKSAQREGDLWHCRLQDTNGDGRCLGVRARTVVNAAGAWATDFTASRVKLRLTKGIHLVVPRERLPVDEAVVMTEGERILFALPWGERTILGTTDTDYAGPTDSPDCTDADVAYVLDIANRTFPRAALKSEEVISCWSGLRPLIADPNGRPSDISRAHQILTGEPGWFDVAGGKLTTYRLMAEQTVDRVCDAIGSDAAQCRTADEPILPTPEDAMFSGVVPPPVCEAAVRHYCRTEWAEHLDDVMIRRSGWRFYEADHLAAASRVAAWMQNALGWSDERTAQELARYRKVTSTRAATWVAFSEKYLVRSDFDSSDFVRF